MVNKGVIHRYNTMEKWLDKYVVSASKGNGAVPGGPKGPPFKVNGFPVFPDPADEGNGKPELIDEEEKK